MRIALLYALFAVAATAVNIASQALWLRFAPRPLDTVAASIMAGTLAGLAVKYALDKRYIFCFKPEHAAHDSRLFMLYSLMGILTTLVFWGAEWLFEILFRDDFMRYLGGVIGLGIGYAAKYHLDKKFVFVRQPA